MTSLFLALAGIVLSAVGLMLAVQQWQAQNNASLAGFWQRLRTGDWKGWLQVGANVAGILALVVAVAVACD